MGGYKATDGRTPQDGCNAITVMCLKASRRLPLNAPCLSLRMHKNMPQEVNYFVIFLRYFFVCYFVLMNQLGRNFLPSNQVRSIRLTKTYISERIVNTKKLLLIIVNFFNRCFKRQLRLSSVEGHILCFHMMTT